tara:strand:- start:602 stop:913 length:312 start_codon:yes stop_codon:yes gene_type:complete
MKRIIGNFLLILILSSFVFAETGSVARTEFNVVESSFKDSRIVEEFSGDSNDVLKFLGILLSILMVFVIVRKLSTSLGFSKRPRKKRVARKRKAVKKLKRKKK